MKYPTFYRTIQIYGLSIFYREAGPADAPILLLLHGLPSSSRMFEPVFSRLSDDFRLVAPDYPGFGHSDWPDPKQNTPGQAEIQSDLFYDYRTNVASCSKWQTWMREKQPRLLVIWGKHDLSFELTEPEAYHRDLPNAEIHVLDAGHFALDTPADEIAVLVQKFAGDSVPALVRRAG
jgi:pimeloyl-ACP methyl ester carboxylesterase